MKEQQKTKVWIDYMVEQIALRYSKSDFSYTIPDVTQKGKMVKRTGVDLKHPTNVHYKDFVSVWLYKDPKQMKIKSRNEFCKGVQDKRVSECLEGWYWRFKNRFEF